MPQRNISAIHRTLLLFEWATRRGTIGIPFYGL